MDKEQLMDVVNQGQLEQYLNRIPVREGQAFYIPSGRVHAIGAGTLLAEIQQASDITYRLYDYNRVDARTGTTRTLHTSEAAAAIDYKKTNNSITSYKRQSNKDNKLLDNQFFKTDFIRVQGSYCQDFKETESFVVFMVVKGSGTLLFEDYTYELKMGSSILLPACINKVNLLGQDFELLRVYL